MKKFIITAESNPKSKNNWYFDFIEGEEIEAESIEEAQKIIDLKCKDYGTDKDEHYEFYGPIAKEV